MKVTRDVVKDLLPLYAAGEASADTRALVEEFLRGDPALSRLAEAAGAQQQVLRTIAADASSEDAARAGLRRTQRLIAWRTWLVGVATFFTLLPGSFYFSDDGLAWMMWRDLRPVAVLSLVLGTLSWIGYFWSRHRLRVTGL